ncbi:hypothetical protein G6F57_015115 [Rhizopus arrhizus]|nr:hypothetical protein G6F21_008433 [Rhizopus arrhizus]KAG1393051.1 hypothetical protein G6F58_012388 [Rhizopus delemar]KAG0809055.1 hypothetical protein G6F20_009076 [Rhizopus arrhizus]KAG0832264.1 hypothetical protein G6F19_006320 [Rhizopus arrhizus]KAG0899904.1 hypothetical protein G6F34_004315 [Rhizopus arrhizus]
MPPTISDEIGDQYSDHVHPWEEILHYVAINQVSQLRRKREDEIVYRKWTLETIEKYKSIENYLIKEKLHFPDIHPSYLILPNDFPYSVEPGTEHILIWSKEPLMSEFVEHLLEQEYGSNVWEWTYFVNPPELQSVRRFPHVHVFMLQ